MKSLALAAVLFCALAALLGYMAITGFGARASSAPPVVVDRSAVQEITQIERPAIEAAPEVEVEAAPAVAKPKPKVAPKRRIVARRQTRETVEKQHTVVAKVSRPQTSGVTESLARPVQRAVGVVAKAVPKRVSTVPARRPEPAVPALAKAAETQEQNLERQIEEDRKWRQETLARWKREEAARRERERKALESEFDRNGRLKERPGEVDREMGMEDARKVDEDKKKKKKRRRTFLGIRL